MSVRIIVGDVRRRLAELPDESVHCVVTSPPYFGLRSYLPKDHPDKHLEIGLETTPAAFVETMVEVFREVRRVLRSDGTLWLNLGDSYANDGKWGGASGGKHAAGLHGDTGIGRGKKSTGLKPKDLIGIPWRVAFALQDDGWWLRQDIIWSKPNPMPESVTDRCTKAHEYVFMLTKSKRYYYDADAIAENAIYVGLANQDESGFQDPRSFNGKHKNGYRTSDKQSEVGKRTYTGFNARWKAAGRKRAVPPRHSAYASSDQSGLDTVGRGGKRNKRSVWEIATSPFPEAHYATFPPALAEPCILAGCPKGGTVLDPFGGAGTTGLVADRLERNAILIDLDPANGEMSRLRVKGDSPLFSDVAYGDAK